MKYVLFFLMIMVAGCANHIPKEGKHLFILSGQSNMWILDPNRSFTPTLEKKFGKENIIVIRDAEGDKTIYEWYKKWSLPQVPWLKENEKGKLYDRLMSQVYPAIKDQPIKTITFVWMQGESDAKRQYAEVYAESLKGLYKQLQDDLHRRDINFVIGRISDYDLKNEHFAHWTKIRDAQMQVAESSSRFCWVDTDDLNDGVVAPFRSKENDLHYSDEGLVILGRRFAESAIRLIEAHDK